MKVYALMVGNQELKIDWYIDSVWSNVDKLKNFIEQMKNLDERLNGWEYRIDTTVYYDY